MAYIETILEQTCDINIYDYVYTFVKREDILFLSENHFYFYNKKELKNIKAVVLLKPLNEIEKLDNTIHDLYSMLNKNTILCGKFIDNKHNDIFTNFFQYTKILEVFVDFVDKKITRLLSLTYVTSCLGAYNFKILNTTEINGITYFYSKKIV